MIVEEDTVWFDGERYQPRIPAGGKSTWFLLDERFLPETRVPTDRPVEPWAGREQLERAFAETYRRWDLPRSEATERALHEVANPGTAVIVSGQQPGFLGGPLYTLFKALTTVATARHYRQRSGHPCVPVFWVAADDHDLDEVRTAYFPGGGGKDVAFTYPAATDRRPLSDYPMDAQSLEVLDALRSELAVRRFGELAAEIADLYRGRNLAAGFAAVLERLLGGTGLVFIDPARLRPMARPLWRRVIEQPQAVLESIARGRAQVESAGLKPFVAARLPLFLIVDGKRHHLEPSPGGLRVSGGGPEFARQDLLEKLEEDPVAFSPGALLRPLVQQFALPCVLTIGGPAEVGYFAQLPPLATTLGLAAPRIGLRLGATLLDGQAARIARRYSLRDLARAGSPEDLLLLRETPEGFEAIHRLAARADETLRDALRALPQATPQLERLRARGEKLPQEIRAFGERFAKAWALSRETELRRVEKLWGHVFPGGVLQERRWSTLHFVAKYGTAWIEELLESLSDDPLKICHRFVTFEPE